MKFREVVIFNGDCYDVPQCIQRIDHRATHGWQLRYGGTKLYSDHSNDGSGAALALSAATAELAKRVAALPAPTTLQSAPSANKSNGLPPGISGPIVRARRGGRVRDCSLGVLVPRFGKTPLRRSIYIGTEHTYTAAKLEAALERAVAMRKEAEEAYQLEATKARRADARELKALVKAGIQSKRKANPRAASRAIEAASVAQAPENRPAPKPRAKPGTVKPVKAAPPIKLKIKEIARVARARLKQASA